MVVGPKNIYLLCALHKQPAVCHLCGVRAHFPLRIHWLLPRAALSPRAACLPSAAGNVQPARELFPVPGADHCSRVLHVNQVPKHQLTLLVRTQGIHGVEGIALPHNHQGTEAIDALLNASQGRHCLEIGLRRGGVAGKGRNVLGLPVNDTLCC